jgi:hypothetical protein
MQSVTELEPKLTPADVDNGGDTHCYICGRYVYETGIPSFSVYEWIPHEGSVFRATFCAAHNPMIAVHEVWARTAK